MTQSGWTATNLLNAATVFKLRDSTDQLLQVIEGSYQMSIFGFGFALLLLLLALDLATTPKY